MFTPFKPTRSTCSVAWNAAEIHREFNFISYLSCSNIRRPLAKSGKHCGVRFPTYAHILDDPSEWHDIRVGIRIVYGRENMFLTYKASEISTSMFEIPVGVRSRAFEMWTSRARDSRNYAS